MGKRVLQFQDIFVKRFIMFKLLSTLTETNIALKIDG